MSANNGRRQIALAMKRLVDIVASAAGLVVLAPLLLVLAIAVRLDSRGPALFKQERVGRFGKPFRMIKFRTMVVGAERIGAGLAITAGDDRITRLGHFLRTTSFDEFPQLWNVLLGQMSLVGPRPLPVRYLERWTPEERRRLDMRQGITGWAQVNGRNEADWDERLRFDIEYVDRWSLQMDATILWRTFVALLGRKGITAEEGSVSEFRAGTGVGEDHRDS